MKKKVCKILSVMLTMILVLCAMQFTALASEVEAEVVTEDLTESSEVADTSASYGVNVALYLMESNNDWSWMGGKWDKPDDWSEPATEPIYITEDGTYTLSLTDLQIPADTLMLCYIKDADAYAQGNAYKQSNVPEDLMVITDVFKVNGSTKQVDSSMVRTGLQKGIFDVAYRNNWNPEDDCVSFTTDINSIEITFTVTGITGEPGAIKYEPPQPTAAPTEVPTPVEAEDEIADANDADEADDTANTSVAPLDEDVKDENNTTLAIVIALIAIVSILVIYFIFKAIKNRR